MGAVLILHGCQKLLGWFGAPAMDAYVKSFSRAGAWAGAPGWVYYIGVLELIGGILLVLGLFTRVVAVQLVGFLAIAAFVVHWPVGYFWSRPGGGWEMPLSWMIICLVILIRGGGAYSLDRKLGKEV